LGCISKVVEQGCVPDWRSAISLAHGPLIMEYQRQGPSLVPLWEAVAVFSPTSRSHYDLLAHFESGVPMVAWAALIQTFNRMNLGAVFGFLPMEVRPDNDLVVGLRRRALQKYAKEFFPKWLILNT